MHGFATVTAALLGALLVLAAAPKLIDLRRFRRALTRYVYVPRGACAVLGLAVPVVELIVGVMLVLSVAVWIAAPVAAALFLAFAVVIVGNIRAGVTRIDCGCFGATTRRLRTSHIVLNMVLALAAGWLFVMAIPADAPPTGATLGSLVGVVLVVIGVYVAHLARIIVEMHALRDTARDRLDPFFGDAN